MPTQPDIQQLRDRLYNAEIIGERIHHGTVMVIRVRPDAEIPVPEPGQWLEMGLGMFEEVMEGAEPGSPRRMPSDGLIKRAYSLSSPILTPDRSRLVEPGEREGFEFFLSLVVPPAERAGKVPNLTGRLFCLRPGDRLFLSDQPMGDYTLESVEGDEDILFLATGTGEAPHNSMIWELLRREHAGRIASLVSVRYLEDLAYDKIHRRLRELFPRYAYRAMATRGIDGDGEHLQDLLETGTLEALADFPLDPFRTRVFLCGNPGMIGPPRVLSGKRVFPEDNGLVELLEARGFNADPSAGPVNIHYERYW
jgi:ferredoxin--NADP+ reductase